MPKLPDPDFKRTGWRQNHEISRRAAVVAAACCQACMAADMDGSTPGAVGLSCGHPAVDCAHAALAPSSGTTTLARWLRPGAWRFCCPSPSPSGPGGGREPGACAVGEYIPFVILLTALFTVAGGIFIRGNLHGSPGSIPPSWRLVRCWPASWAPRASMLLIRPLIRANDNRKHVAHVVVSSSSSSPTPGLAHAAGRSRRCSWAS